MLDKLAPEWRHLIIIIVPVLIAWVTQEIPNWHLPVSLSALIGVLASAILLWFTGVTKQYGLFSTPKE
jgi:hypothetical protein